MLQQFIELSLLVIGLYALITGKLPLVIGSNPKYSLEARIARLIGILFIAPLPTLMCIGVFMNLMRVPLDKILFMEPLVILLIIIIVAVIIQKSRKPVEAMDNHAKETL